MSVQFNKTGIINASGESGIGENLILDSINRTASHLTSGNEYIAINVGQSYMNVPSGTQVTFSFDVEIKIMNQSSTASNNKYFQVYNSNNKGPKQFGGVRLDSQVFDDTQTVGNIYKKRVYATTTITNRDSPTVSDNYMEFYTVYGTGNVFRISNIKCELGNRATPWIPNPNDQIYVGSNHGFIEQDNIMKTYPNFIQTNEFIEY